jgi:hypothetical protein
MVVEFPGSKIHSEFAPALKDLTASGAIRILDMVFIRKDANGQIETLELGQLDPRDAKPFEELDGEIDDLISMEDIQTAAASLPPDSISGLFVWEDVGSTRFADAVRSAQGAVMASKSIPSDVVEAAMTAASAPHA